LIWRETSAPTGLTWSEQVPFGGSNSNQIVPEKQGSNKAIMVPQRDLYCLYSIIYGAWWQVEKVDPRREGAGLNMPHGMRELRCKR
jgi:hypothetical protein